LTGKAPYKSANHRFHGGRADRSHKDPSCLEEITDSVTEKTARLLNLSIPPALLARADEVIE
jgi:hypothetical protein